MNINVKNHGVRSILKGIFGALLFSAMLPAASLAAGGVSLGATRVIYDQSDKQTSLAILNSDQKSRYLVQSWVEDKNEKKTSDFIITPPLFVIDTKSENTIRIINVNDSLPKDRESVYWLNVKAIPEVSKDSVDGKNVLQLAILTRIKLFVRPSTLTMASSQAPGKISYTLQGNQMIISNPTPYFVNMVNVSLGGKKLDAIMASPMDKTVVKIPGGVTGELRFSAISDFGAVSPVTTVTPGK
ncbi:fimbria/pilus periplasmic chaperone [Tatumella sp. JGM100]|uniref:Fimbria/pilus periplasmic chaperone n=2 Tax=Tatumella TaxID=82986 RepID=A0ABW1VRC9_9GAMM|nr:fimbria/pilus periplasmic chaperone [Tatumella sp. JGM16]MBS0877922.1 fimbria/pilus periplasmic chaperone [Tatumella sp. JGM82]MBS0891628.1 fimbria/pilus periplasmic chaperone [Tatumella sp. JGM94]MBS0893827.1 fimbria/pilus periplasmic chaperone [Tatumella sp. JGM130]MBS0902548.1 fimbria/pilus periplasmic chaperone [Tatumella sp. JGM100]MBS0913483.1 fimbria/pilus periplasmic chaperone [Tatumella sp. JGM91]